MHKLTDWFVAQSFKKNQESCKATILGLLILDF